MKDQAVLLQFNRGRISPLALGRFDLKRVAISAEEQTNFIPKSLGPMAFRPGLRFIDDQVAITKLIPFIFSATDASLIEIQDGTVSIVTSDVRVTRPTVTAAVANGNFDTGLGSWSSVDPGTVNAWQTGGYAGLAGDGTAISALYQEVTVNQGGVEHALRVIVQRGPIKIRIGSTNNGTEYLDDTELRTGSHSLAFTPTSASFWVKVFNQNNRLALIDSVNVESGDMYLAAPWTEALLRSIRWDQSGDIVFLACAGVQQRRILRRSARSWSIDVYEPEDGPFLIENTTTTTLAPSALFGNITVTSSAVSSGGVFRSTNVGSLYSITSVGQTVSVTVSADAPAAGTFSDAISVSGITSGRTFGVVITGTFVQTITLQRSFDFGATWQDTGTTYTTPVSTSYTDGLENQLISYRIGVKDTGWTSGTSVSTLTYSAGSITGVVRVTGFTSTTSVSAEVLKTLGGTSASDTWAEGTWSARRGFPSAVAFLEGRLWWAGKDKFLGSVTDQFETFDPNFVGNAGPINRSIGSGPVDTINWLAGLQRLLAGTGGSVVSVRSSSFDEPLTPTNFNPKIPITQGVANVNPVKVDGSEMFVQQNGSRVMELNWDGAVSDYTVTDLTELVPEVGSPGIVAIAVQRQPDTRVHCVRSDGTVAMLVFNKVENVVAWVDVETHGFVYDACVLPGATEDAVYYSIERGPDLPAAFGGEAYPLVPPDPPVVPGWNTENESGAWTFTAADFTAEATP